MPLLTQTGLTAPRPMAVALWLRELNSRLMPYFLRSLPSTLKCACHKLAHKRPISIPLAIVLHEVWKLFLQKWQKHARRTWLQEQWIGVDVLPPTSFVARTRASSAASESVIPGSTGAQITPAFSPAAHNWRTASSRRSDACPWLQSSRQLGIERGDGEVHE